MSDNRVKSGIPGLDPKIGGGFEQDSTVLIEGGPGSGKTMFGLEFINQGLTEGETVLYASFEEDKEDIISDMEEIGLKPRKYLDQQKLIIELFSPLNFEYLPVMEVISKFNVKRMVIDSLSSLWCYFKDEFEFRKFLLDFLENIKKKGVTTLFLSEQDEQTPDTFKMYGTSFLMDSYINLFYTGLGSEYDRSLRIVKMRRTNHVRELIPMRIDDKGLYVK